MSIGPGASSSELAQQVRSDFRQARVAGEPCPAPARADILDAAPTVRRLVAAAGASTEFLAPTAFLDAPED
ncbi:hypothetical protein [Streptomyces tailanensis]|uniref:hypothetical protein n=1 Tax=Streptomyces tailanensis TaxID=2569858 RepID=UPI00122E89FA|nr:hypothetical protein [Streptomyces tailanensis]